MSNDSLPAHWRLRALDLEPAPGRDAADLAAGSVEAFRDALLETWTEGVEAAAVRSRLEAYAARLRATNPSDAGVARAMERALAVLDAPREQAGGRLEELLREARGVGEALVRAAEPLFRPGARPLVLGRSAVVEALLRGYLDRLENITVCEGRPRGDGVQLGAELAETGVPVRLVTESQLDLVVPECDLPLAAAERVLPNGDVVARAGTAVLARLCAAHQVPFHVVAARSAWIAEGDPLAHFARERRPPSEVLPGAPRGLQVVNLANDLTPAALVSSYVTEEGVVRGACVRGA